MFPITLWSLHVLGYSAQCRGGWLPSLLGRVCEPTATTMEKHKIQLGFHHRNKLYHAEGKGEMWRAGKGTCLGLQPLRGEREAPGHCPVQPGMGAGGCSRSIKHLVGFSAFERKTGWNGPHGFLNPALCHAVFLEG